MTTTLESLCAIHEELTRLALGHRQLVESDYSSSVDFDSKVRFRFQKTALLSVYGSDFFAHFSSLARTEKQRLRLLLSALLDFCLHSFNQISIRFLPRYSHLYQEVDGNSSFLGFSGSSQTATMHSLLLYFYLTMLRAAMRRGIRCFFFSRR